jgi:hypothetical protein
MAAYVTSHPREARPAHRYSIGDAHLAEERKLFQRYQSFSKVQSES